jgi:hypothetical protein
MMLQKAKVARIDVGGSTAGGGPVSAAAMIMLLLKIYYLYKQVIQRLAALGMKWYSFSVPWAQFLPLVFT